MKDCTRVRRLTKIWVAFNNQTITVREAFVMLYKLGFVMPTEEQAKEMVFAIHSLYLMECVQAWNKFNGLTDLGRERFLKEIQP